MRGKLAAVSGKKPEAIAIIPQACEEIYEKKLSDPVLQLRFKDTFNVVFTGNISPAQSFKTMLDAAELLVHQGLDNIRWIIVGDGMSRKEVEKEVNKRQLNKYFVFEGQKPIDDMPKYADIANVLVGCLVKSDLLEATIPAKVMSYIAMAKPIVLAMDGEVQDLINTTIGCGLAGKTDDYRTLAKNIENIYRLTPNQRAKMGDRARSYHQENFSRKLLLGKLYNFIFTPGGV
jgi:glycosyltransferase involved in cell wall biosynthesis